MSVKLTGEHSGRKGWGELAMLPAMCADWGMADSAGKHDFRESGAVGSHVRAASAQNQRRLARDFAQRLGVFDSALDNLFGPQGPWTPEEEILP